MQVIHVLSRTTNQTLYKGTDAAQAHRIACDNLALKPIKEMEHITPQLQQAYNGIDPLNWYIT